MSTASDLLAALLARRGQDYFDQFKAFHEQLFTEFQAVVSAASGSATTAEEAADLARQYAAAAVAAAAGVNLPGISVADALKVLRVKADGSGYEVADPGGVLAPFDDAEELAATVRLQA